MSLRLILNSHLCGSSWRFRRNIVYQTRIYKSDQGSLFPCSKKEFSSISQQSTSTKAVTNAKTHGSQRNLLNLVVGSTLVAAGASLLVAYQGGYFDNFVRNERSTSRDATKINAFHEDEANQEDSQIGESVRDNEDEKSREASPDLPSNGSGHRIPNHNDHQHGAVELSDANQLGLNHHEIETLDENLPPSQSRYDGPEIDDTVTENSLKEMSENANSEADEGYQDEKKTFIYEDDNPEEISEDVVSESNGENAPDLYHLHETVPESTAMGDSGSQESESSIEELADTYIMKDGKIMMTFLEAIHEAEKRQAELDALAFDEKLRILRENHEKELRDLRARELMHAEEVAMLDKEMQAERSKTAAAIRTLQEKMEKKLTEELERKESEAAMKQIKLKELAKAELSAAIVREKASQIEKMAEANLHLDALRMAFHAQYEVARELHSIHKLALGTLSLEDALYKGLPIQQEVKALSNKLEDADEDSLLHLVLLSLPKETQLHGTDSILQLNQKLSALKGLLRHYILIPPGGSGSISTHIIARIASWLRVREADPSGDGIESVITRVERLLADGHLVEAADALQDGVRGSQAESVAAGWVRLAKNRAIIEQASTLLRAYATSLTLSH